MCGTCHIEECTDISVGRSHCFCRSGERTQNADGFTIVIKHKPVIVKAHALYYIVYAHEDVVMKEGRIVQWWIHDVLSTAEGVYKNMWDAYTNAYQWTLNKN